MMRNQEILGWALAVGLTIYSFLIQSPTENLLSTATKTTRLAQSSSPITRIIPTARQANKTEERERTLSPLGIVELTEDYALLSARIDPESRNQIHAALYPLARLNAIADIEGLNSEETKVLQTYLLEIRTRMQRLFVEGTYQEFNASGQYVTRVVVDQQKLRNVLSQFKRSIEPFFPESRDKVSDLLLGKTFGEGKIDATINIDRGPGGGMVNVKFLDPVGGEMAQIMLTHQDRELLEKWTK